MNNQSNTSSTVGQCKKDIYWHILDISLFYVIPQVGSIFNLICVIVFIKIIKQESTATRSTDKSNMFKYLLLKSISDFLVSLSRIPSNFYFNADGTNNTSLILNIWYMYINYYFIYVLQVSSNYYEIAAAFDLLLLVNRKFQPLRERFIFYIIGSVIAIFSFLFYIPFILLSEITSKDGKYVFKTLKSYFFYKFLYFHYLIRDIIPLVLLILINYFILVSLNNIRKKRQTMMKNSNHTDNRNHRRSEMNKIKMILVICILYLFHLPLIINNNFNLKLIPCYEQLFVLLFHLSYFLPIFSYLLFNNSFKLHFFEFFSFCRRSN
jgi:hypothetical protein